MIIDADWQENTGRKAEKKTKKLSGGYLHLRLVVNPTGTENFLLRFASSGKGKDKIKKLKDLQESITKLTYIDIINGLQKIINRGALASANQAKTRVAGILRFCTSKDITLSFSVGDAVEQLREFIPK